MFSVPGWSVDSTFLAEEKPAARTSHQAPSSTSTSSSKKRKFTLPHSDQASKVSGPDLDRLWNQRAGAKPPRPEQGPRREPIHDILRQDDLGEGSATREKKKHEKTKSKERLERIPKTEEQVIQHKRSRKSRDSDSNLNNGDAPTTSFPRETVLKALPPAPPPSSKLTPLQAKMRNKLTSARFRHLNETLYTTSSSAAMNLFTTSPDLFAEYHAGFSQQVKESWPVNPVDKYIAAVKTRGLFSMDEKDGKQRSSKNLPLPRRPKTSLCTIADLGCGDAPLARGCQSITKSHKLRFHNFDLHAPNTQVTKADISNLPLRDGEADVAVFCLSLMGTNWISFVEEAWRILRGDGKGECWVSEVKSRFGRVGRRPKGEAVENSVGKRRKNQKPRKKGADADEDQEADIGNEVFAEDANLENPGDDTDISAFVRVFSRRGFALREDSVDRANKMFVSMVFIKSGVPQAGKHKGLKWTGREYQKVDESKTRGKAMEDEDLSPQEEAKVLKPCVYKTR